LIAHLHSKPQARAPVVKKVVAKRKPPAARVAQTAPASTPYAYATPVPTVAVKPQRVKTKTVRAKVAKRVTPVAKRGGEEFGFEGKGGSAAAAPSAPVASAASVGGGSGSHPSSSSSGGGAAKSSSAGGEFGFEGGG
jgi:hypothetical protein